MRQVRASNWAFTQTPPSIFIKKKNVSGTLITMCGEPIYWKLKKQAIMTLSSIKAEYIAAGETIKDLAWIQQLINELGLEQENPTTLYTNNQSAIDLTDKSNTEKRFKHIDLRYHYIRQQVQNGKIQIKHMGTTDLPADELIKELEKIKFKIFIKQFRMIEI